MNKIALQHLSAQVSAELKAAEDALISGLSFTDACSAINATLETLENDPRAGAQRLVSQIERTKAAHYNELTRVTGLYQTMYEAAGIPVFRVDDHTLELDQPHDACHPVIVGIDEVGRGPLAGPLTVAAVVLPREPFILYLNDSKKLRPQKRAEVAAQIARVAEAIAIEHIDADTIDEIGITNALRLGMRRALRQLQITDPQIILIDGNPIRAFEKERCIVQGDGRIASIAAASIVAKVARDELMINYDSCYPGYTFAQSKGYGSADHIAALKAKGFSPIHRRSFCKSILGER